MRFRNSSCFKLLTLTVLICTAIALSCCEIVWAQAAKKTIPAGTPVQVRIDQTANSKTYRAGAKVPATVVSDVIIDGMTLIRAGAPCDVTVISSRKAGAVGQEGEIILSISAVTAADGSRVPLSDARASDTGKSALTTALVVAILCCILGLLIKGKEGEIAAGTQVTAYTVGNVDVNI